jgi:hypothetical protein
MESVSINSEIYQNAANKTASKSRKFVGKIIYLASFVTILFLYLDGQSFYSTPLNERPHHQDYRDLRPAGRIGLTYGIVGASMMIIMLVYSVRKRTRLLGQKPRLGSYLNFHIYLGIFGPLLITLHTSFKFNGLVAVSYWSMVAVALSGFFGRFLYQQIPKNINDQELSLKQIEESIRQTTVEMQGRGKLFEEAHNLLVSQLNKIYSKGNRGTIRSIFRMMFLNLLEPVNRRRFRKKVRRIVPITGSQYQELFEVACRQSELRLQVSILSDVQKLFHHWHVIHKPFAIIMYIIMGVHIGVAIWTGYGWFN